MRLITISTLIILIALISCKNESDVDIDASANNSKLISIPKVVTKEIIKITSDSIICIGEILDDGNDEIIAKGVVCGTNKNPTIENNIAIKKDEGETISFTSKIGNLQPYTNYFLRTFATNSKGTGYGLEMDFKTLDLSGNFIDNRDGNVYDWVKIGEQIWMAENLAYLPKMAEWPKAAIDVPIFYVYGYTGWNVNIAKALDYYEFYGVLYNWKAAQSACPEGWHIPTEVEWEKLARFISDENEGCKKLTTAQYGDWDGVGKYLKSISDTWYDVTIENTDKYGFSGLPGGHFRWHSFDLSNFWAMKHHGTYWSETIIGRRLYSKNAKFERVIPILDEAFSVRCIKD